jgi:hypothetical protein
VVTGGGGQSSASESLSCAARRREVVAADFAGAHMSAYHLIGFVILAVVIAIWP